MPSAVKERLQRRLASRNTGASGALSDPSEDMPNSADQSASANYCLRRGFGPAELAEAEKCFPSLVEEIAPSDCIASFLQHCPESFTEHHSAVTFVSRCPLPDMRNAWQRFVRVFDLHAYYVKHGDERHVELQRIRERASTTANLERRRVAKGLTSVQMILAELERWTAKNVSAKLSAYDALLAAIFGQLDSLDFYAVGTVCRRWHFVGRCTWNFAPGLEICGSDVAPFIRKGSDSLRAGKLIYRVPLLTKIVFSDVGVSYESFIIEANVWPFLTTLHLCNIMITSTTRRGALCAEANDKICQFVKGRMHLSELVLLNVQLCCAEDKTSRKRVVQPLNFQWRLPEAKCNGRLRGPLTNVQLSLSLLGQQDKASFLEFCGLLFVLKNKAIIFSGLASLNPPAILSEPVFGQCLAEVMPRLREISLCSVKFGSSAHLKSETIDLLAKEIRYNSNLELFCLTNGEISEEAISNLQRCRKLQILILLRCTITKANPELRLMADWHPNANLPSSLITDCVTVPRWFKPIFFRVVRIKNFSDFNGAKFTELRKRWWSIDSLLKSCELGLEDFCYGLPTPHEDEAEDILADAPWFH